MTRPRSRWNPFPPFSWHVRRAVLGVILSNLIGNAVKFTRSCPVRRITVRAMQVGDQARVEVEDSGPGLPAELQGRLFEPYVRGTTKQPGLGLGLATESSAW